MLRKIRLSFKAIWERRKPLFMAFAGSPAVRQKLLCGVIFASVVFICGFYSPYKYYSFQIILLAMVVFFLSFINNHFGLILIIFSALLSPEFDAGGITGRSVVIRIEDILLLFISLGWLAKASMHKGLGMIRPTPLNKPIIMYMIVCVLSTGLAVMAGITKLEQGFFYMLKYFEYFMVFFMVVSNLKDMKQAKLYIMLMLLVCVLVCVYAYTRIPSGERLSAPFEGEGGEPNTLSGYLVFMMAIIIGFILYPKSNLQRLVLTGILGAAAVVLVYTLSRGGWVAFFPMALTIVILDKRHRLILGLFFIVFIFLLPRTLPEKVNRRVDETFATEKPVVFLGKKYYISESTAARVNSWHLGLERFIRRPILGYGIPSGNVIDNQYTRILTETGIVGFILFFLFIIRRIFLIARDSFLNAQDDNFRRAVSLGFLAGIVGLLAHSLSVSTFILIRIMEPFWFIAGIMVAMQQLPPAAGEVS